MIKSIFLTAFDLTKKNAIVLIGVFLSMVLLSFLIGLLGELLRQQIIASVVFNIFSLMVNITIYMRLGFVNYLIIDKEIEVGSAFMISYQFTKGKLGFIILLYLAILALNIIGLAFLLIGVLFTIPMSFMIIALAYRYLFPKELLEEPSFLI